MVRCFRTAAVTLALFACLVSSIQAQNAASGAPKAYKKNEKAITDPKLVKSHAKEAAEALRGSNFGAAEQAIVKRYFVDTVMAGMTLQSNDPQQFPKWREQIVKALGSLSSASGSARHDYLRGEVFRVAKAMAEDPEYSPQCRYNSLLILGELNDAEMQRNGQNVQPAVPSTQARKVLLDLFKNEKESQALRLAALIGLQRHERLLAAAGRTDNDIVQAAKSTLSMSTPPANGTADGLHWMQRIAVDILASHGKGAEAALLEPILSDAKRPMLVRCAAAEALGRLDYAGVTNLNAAALSKGLGQIALTACQNEILSLQSKVAASPLEGGGVIRSEPIEGERPTEKQAPENPDVKLARRQLKYQLTCVSQGLTGLLKATMDDNSKSAMTSLKTQVDAVLKTLEPAPDLQPASLLDKISQPAVQLEKLVNSLS